MNNYYNNRNRVNGLLPVDEVLNYDVGAMAANTNGLLDFSMQQAPQQATGLLERTMPQKNMPQVDSMRQVNPLIGLSPMQVLGRMQIDNAIAGKTTSMEDAMDVYNSMVRNAENAQDRKLALENRQMAIERAKQKELQARQKQAQMMAWVNSLPPEQRAVAMVNPEKYYAEYLKKQEKNTLTSKDKYGISKDFDTATKDFRKVQTAYNTMVNLANAEPTGINDLNLIISIAKVYDPSSVVREGEVEAISNSSSLPQSLVTYWRKVASGEKLPAQLRKELVESAKQKYKASEKNFTQFRDSYINRARHAGFGDDDIEVYFPDYRSPNAVKMQQEYILVDPKTGRKMKTNDKTKYEMALQSGKGVTPEEYSKKYTPTISIPTQPSEADGLLPVIEEEPRTNKRRTRYSR